MIGGSYAYDTTRLHTAVKLPLKKGSKAEAGEGLSSGHPVSGESGLAFRSSHLSASILARLADGDPRASPAAV